MGIQSKNRKEWVLCHVANMHQNITTVALYDTLGPDATRFVLNQTELTTMSVSKDYVSKLAKMKISDASEGQNLMKRLTTLVVFENDIEAADRALAEQAGLKIYSLEQVAEAGRLRQNKTEADPLPTDHIMFSYTSGTTGDPKGVKLTHKMILSTTYAVNTRFGPE